jgi:MFS superfamily sulfate permease-like transporter
MLASLAVMPFVGTIPIQATAGILIYVGLILVPWKNFFNRTTRLPRLDLFVAVASAAIAFVTYGIDKAILLGFVVYSFVIIKHGSERTCHHADVTLLLLAAVTAQW